MSYTKVKIIRGQVVRWAKNVKFASFKKLKTGVFYKTINKATKATGSDSIPPKGICL